MRTEPLLPRQCILCPDPLPCNCAADEDCFVINRDCNTCSQTKCVGKQSGSSAKSHGANPGATAGAVLGVVTFLVLALVAIFWYRRKNKKLGERISEVPKDVPASAETVLQRPDPTEKRFSSQTEASTVRSYSNSASPIIELDHQSQRPSPNFSAPPPQMNLNPFDDATSIQTVGTEGTNVIPIALVPSESFPCQISSPIRPVRSPDLDLNIEANARNVNHRPSNSDRSLKSTNRNSYMSNASYASDFLNEAPMIITPTKTSVRQVLGVVKAEVINAPGSHLKLPTVSRPAIGSPLAASSFGPADVVKEVDEDADPFSDEASVNHDSNSPSDSLLQTAPDIQTGSAAAVPDSSCAGEGRPLSVGTQVGSIIDIGSASRVKIGPHVGCETFPTSYRTTVGRLINPGSEILAEQQRTLVHAQAQARGLDISRRVSTSSALSSASTRADSILESFPFVPPSPISNRPVRSPPISPLGKQSFANDAALSSNSSNPNHFISVHPPTPESQEFSPNDANRDTSLPPPPDRRILGLSTGSQLSTSSSGLESFPFQIDSGDGNVTSPTNSFIMKGRQRASLDTLALTSDLSSYPLGFERNSVQTNG